MGEQDTSNLVRLSRSDLMIDDPGDDIRGRQVVTVGGEKIGEVDDLLIDITERKVRFLDVGSGGFLGIGEHKSLVPVEAVSRLDEDHVYIDHALEHVAGAPHYHPTVDVTDRYVNSIYGYYGYTPPPWVPGAETE
jgi:sporulation protein YlmC with PRC-barrel domain